MKTSELKKILIENGCKFLREGGNHEYWIGVNGNRFALPRHKGQEMKKGTVNGILKQAGLK